MSYWKGLLLAVAIDAVWIMGCPATATGPDPLPRQLVEVGTAPDIQALHEIGRLEDSVMLHLRQHPEDVDALEKLAHAYTEQGWFEAAIGPLARALQLDPTRRRLWVLLDRAVEKTERERITDVELTERALQFKETVNMWGHGC